MFQKAEEKFQAEGIDIQTRWNRVHTQTEKPAAKGKRGKSPKKEKKGWESNQYIMQANTANLERKSQRGLFIQKYVKL